MTRHLNRLFVLGVLLALAACGSKAPTEMQHLTSGDLQIVLLSDHDAIVHGDDTFSIEFRKVSDKTLVDVGDVKATATMPMSGSPMFGTIDVQRTSTPGRYTAKGSLSMAGTWRMTLEWTDANGIRSIAFATRAQ